MDKHDNQLRPRKCRNLRRSDNAKMFWSPTTSDLSFSRAHSFLSRFVENQWVKERSIADGMSQKAQRPISRTLSGHKSLFCNKLLPAPRPRLGIPFALLPWEAASVQMLAETLAHLPGNPGIYLRFFIQSAPCHRNQSVGQFFVASLVPIRLGLSLNSVSSRGPL